MEDVTSVRKTTRRPGTGAEALSETRLREESEEFFFAYTIKILSYFKVTATRLMKVLRDAINSRDVSDTRKSFSMVFSRRFI